MFKILFCFNLIFFLGHSSKFVLPRNENPGRNNNRILKWGREVERFLYDIVKDVKFESRLHQTQNQRQTLKPRKSRTRRNKSLEAVYPNPKRYYEQLILSNI